MSAIVVIPYIKEDEWLAKKHADMCIKMAGISCDVVAIEDETRKGWVAIHNDYIRACDHDYYCYSAADYKPGENFLKLAIERLNDDCAGLCAFNDGKWDGRIASVGVVTRTYYNDNGLFHSGYKCHGADDEITDKAKELGIYTYEPNAILAEIDGRKEQENKNYNKEDQELYAYRRDNTIYR